MGLFSRTARCAVGSRAPRLRIERLELRDCPANPAITDFNVTRLQDHSIQVSGVVLDESPTTVQVRVAGVANGFFYPNALGVFSGQATTTGFGQITGRAYDNEGLLSPSSSSEYQNLSVTDASPNVTNALLSDVNAGSGSVQNSAVNPGGTDPVPFSSLLPNLAPVIDNFYASQSGNWWILRGHVIDEAPAGLIVTFHSAIAAIDGHTTTVLANGDFFEPFLLKFGVSGYVTAQTTDWFGLSSNVPQTWVG
jgi:hypothetical protein